MELVRSTSPAELEKNYPASYSGMAIYRVAGGELVDGWWDGFKQDWCGVNITERPHTSHSACQNTEGFGTR